MCEYIKRGLRILKISNSCRSYSTHEPPKPIELWLRKAPIVFLAISAAAFVIGLNLFPYSSHQVRT